MPALYARGREAPCGNARVRALAFRATAMRNSFHMLGKATVLTLPGPPSALQPRGAPVLQVARESHAQVIDKQKPQTRAYLF